MNQVLQSILDTGTVFDGEKAVPAHSHIPPGEGEMLAMLIDRIKARKTIEVGCAHGISTLYICEALAKQGDGVSHTVIDPGQRTEWGGIGLRNCEVAGFSSIISFHEEKSELCLPRLLSQGQVYDLAFIDGWHTLDHTLIDFFYINRMLRTGGIVVFDDTYFPSINKLLRYLLAYPAYELFSVFGMPDEQKPLLERVKAKGFSDWSSLPPAFFGISVALQKVADDDRNWDWFAPF